jgi:protocatechuate 3,4-dioxygenase beta subunit
VVLAVATLQTTSGLSASDDQPPAFRGRVLDETGNPVPGAHVGLYIQTGRWERQDILIRKITTGADGAFAFVKPAQRRPAGATSANRGFILLADHPQYAVGWRTVAMSKPSFHGDIVLTGPISRTFTVTDEKGRPLPGATVAVMSLGERDADRADFREVLDVKLERGPLSEVTDLQGKATMAHLPRTFAIFVASAPGYAPTLAVRDHDRFRLTRAARLSGVVKDQDHKPLAGAVVILQAEFVYHFERVLADADGKFQFSGLPARGWDMSSWTPGIQGDGTYSVAIEDPDHTSQETKVWLDPDEDMRDLEILAVPGIKLAVRVVERSTGRAVPGVRVEGTTPSGRLDGLTGPDGLVTGRTVPGRVLLDLASVPQGQYIDGELARHPGIGLSFDVMADDGTVASVLTLPPLRGRLIAVEGQCRMPDGRPASCVVFPSAGTFETAQSRSEIRSAHTNAGGEFTLEDVPSRRRLSLYAETYDAKYAGGTVVDTPEQASKSFHPILTLVPTVQASRILKGKDGRALASRKLLIQPEVGDERIAARGREVMTDEHGRLEVSGIVPGLAYHLEEQRVLARDRKAFAPFDDYAQSLVLAPARP